MGRRFCSVTSVRSGHSLAGETPARNRSGKEGGRERGKERERKKTQQQLPSIYSLGEQLHKNTFDCHRVTSSEDNCRQQLTFSSGLIKVKSGTGEKKKRITTKLNPFPFSAKDAAGVQSRANAEVGTGEGRYAR